jgi:hypothetical protein
LPYVPRAVTFTDDGAVWTIGHVKSPDLTREIQQARLERFDQSGKVTISSNVRVSPGMDVAAASLNASRDRIGWLNTENYIEFSLDGTEIARYDLAKGSVELDTGVALSDSNEVIAGRFSGGKNDFVMLNRTTKNWEPISLPEREKPNWARVLGFDGDTIVTTSTNGTFRRYVLNAASH